MNFSKSFKNVKALRLGALLLMFFSFNVGISQIALPVSRTAWGTTPSGWTDTPLLSYLTSFACSGSDGARFDATGNRKIVNFSGTPGNLSFVVKSNAATTSSLLVEESADGSTYTTVINLIGTAALPVTCTTKGTYALNSLSRYVRWTFTKGTSNLTMDDVMITAGAAPTIVATPATLSGFTYGFGSGPSANQTFTCSGTLLTANITLTAPTNYEISTDGTSFSSSLTLTPTSGSVAATTIYVRLIAGLAVNPYNSLNVVCSSTGATAVNVVCNGTVTSTTPSIIITPTTLSAFSYGFGSGPSTTQTFTASGTLLTGNITLVAPTNYEISLSAGSGFGASLTLTPTSGTVPTTTIYVRLKSGLAVASYNSENIVCASTGATSVNLVCNGSVTPVAPEINLKGNATSIADGDVSPVTTDHTDFGSVAPAASLTRTFTIENTGNAALNISGASPYVVISGADAADFSITTAPSNSISGASSTTFVVTFTSSVLGLHSAILTINSNDSDEAIYNFSIQATVATPPIGVVAAAGDFRPLYATDLSINGSWEYFNGSAWVAVPDGKAPQNTTTTINRVIINTYVGGAGSDLKAYNCDFIIESGGELDLVANDAPPVAATMIAAGKKIEVLSGGLLNIRGDIAINATGSIIVRTGGAMILDQPTLSNIHPLWAGVELFENQSTVTLKDWNWSEAAMNRSLINISTAITSNADGYKFGNFIFNATPTDNWTLIGGGIGVINLCQNDLDITNSSAFYVHGATNKTGTNGFLVNGNMTIHDGSFNFGTSYSADAFIHQFVINGNFLCSSNDVLKIHHIGNLVPTGLTGKVTFKGNVTVASSVTSFTNNTSSVNTRMYVDFDGGTIASPIHVDIAPVAVAISMNVLTNSFVKLKNNHLVTNSIASNTAIFTVQTGGSFHFNWAADGTTPLVVRKTTTSPLGTNNFISKIGSDLYITSTWGIMANPYLLGNVQMETRTYESLADFHYIGLLSQEAGNGLPVDIRNLEINNSGGVGNNHVYLSNFSKVVHNTLKMQKGNIITDLDTIIILGSATTELGILDYTEGFVIGRMKRWFTSTNSGIPSGLFPMGVTPAGPLNRHCLIEFTTAPSAGGHLTVEFIPIDMGTAGLTILAANTGGFGRDVLDTEDQGYWKIDNEATKLVDGQYTIACTGEGFTPITALADLTLLKRVGGTDWFCPGTHVAATGTTAKPTCSRTGVSNWSNFGFSSGVGAILPIELISFEANCLNSKVNLTWETASERDNDYFTIEQSLEGNTFVEVMKIKAAGNTNQITEYSQEMSNFTYGYFRLKQTDFNGTETILKTIAVNCSEDAISVYPNPSTGIINIESTKIEKIIVYNQLGQEVRTYGESGHNATIDLSDLAKGIYHLSISNASETKFVKIEIVN